MAWEASRRVFLKGAGLAAVGVGIGPSPLMLRAAEAAADGKSVLVHVFFRGGFDGLNFLTPYDDPHYQEARPGIALRRDDPDPARRALPLDGYFGLHSGLAPLEALYRDGRLGFVPAVGHLKLSRSHFDAQDFIEHATPGQRATTDGWLGRAVAQIPGAQVTDQIAFTSVLPRTYGGTEPVLVSPTLARFDVSAGGTGPRTWTADAEPILRKMYQGSPQTTQVGRSMFAAIDVLGRTPGLSAAAPPDGGATYPAGSALGNALREAARVVKARIGTRTIFISVNGAFDTHANQLPANALEFGRIGQALAAFAQDLGPKLDDVVVLGLTEFGRTFTQNGSLGTDHGAGSCAFYMGGGVRGGKVLGRWPGLSRSELNEQRELMPTTDFRDLFAEVLQKHLGVADLARVLPGHSPQPVGML